MFNNYLGSRVVPVTASHIPTKPMILWKKDSLDHTGPKQTPGVFYVATRDTATGNIYLKLLNVLGSTEAVDIQLNGKAKIMKTGKTVVMKAMDPLETNSIDNPVHIIPVESTLKGIKKHFRYSMAPYSIQVIQIQTK